MFLVEQGSYCAVLEIAQSVCPKPDRRHYNSLGITALVPEPSVTTHGLINLILIMQADDVSTTKPLSEDVQLSVLLGCEVGYDDVDVLVLQPIPALRALKSENTVASVPLHPVSDHDRILV